VRTPDEDGLFGPGSVTWRIMTRPEILVGGFRAAYLQALHPRVMRCSARLPDHGLPDHGLPDHGAA
jgi:uncharacterized protein (DUF2236 family)